MKKNDRVQLIKDNDPDGRFGLAGDQGTVIREGHGCVLVLFDISRNGPVSSDWWASPEKLIVIK